MKELSYMNEALTRFGNWISKMIIQTSKNINQDQECE